ncbi:hypothetical protein CGCSCA5_v005597 [Colletotrichum siamense]|nr:hypothetical protein CGCSCA5_v005597 [Colletotrichum siamense]
MPTATLTSQYAITNIGPLTTVFTVPTACATRSPDLWLADQDRFVTDRVAVHYKQSCGIASQGTCFPSGQKMDAAYSSASIKGNSVLPTIAYFSPASLCPDAYTTVGSAFRGDDGNITSSGVFAPPVVPKTVFGGGTLGQSPRLSVLMEVLEEGETAVLCCPEGYIVGKNGGCFSSVQDSVYGEKTACPVATKNGDFGAFMRAITYNGTAVTTGSFVSFGPISRPSTNIVPSITENIELKPTVAPNTEVVPSTPTPSPVPESEPPAPSVPSVIETRPVIETTDLELAPASTTDGVSSTATLSPVTEGELPVSSVSPITETPSIRTKLSDPSLSSIAESIESASSVAPTSSVTGDVFAVAYKPAVTMLYNRNDEGAGGGGGDATATETASNAACRMRMTTSGGSAGILAMVWTLAALAGFAIVLPH